MVTPEMILPVRPRAKPHPCATESDFQRIQRYRYFRPLVRGVRVLELDCLKGDAADYLAREAAQVTATTSSAEFLDEARNAFVRSNLSFDSSIPRQVSFDVASVLGEPLTAEGASAAIARARESLATDGILLISLPPNSISESRARLVESFPCVKLFHQTSVAPWDLVPGEGSGSTCVAVCGAPSLETRLREFVAPTGIIILCHDNQVLSDQCVRSIAQFTPEPIELVIVDNGSTDATPRWTAALREAFANVRVITNKENRGFAPAVNQGLAVLRGRNVVLLNNDVLVTPGWLSRLSVALREDGAAGMAGAVSNYAASPQKVDIPAYDADGSSSARYAVQHAVNFFGRTCETRRLSFFCVLFRHRLVDQIGGLDERFVPGFFEDDDYTLRARLAGFRIWVAADVFVHHAGSQTFKKVVADPMAPLQINWTRFKEKWRGPKNLGLGNFYPCDVIAPTEFDPKRDYLPLPC